MDDNTVELARIIGDTLVSGIPLALAVVALIRAECARREIRAQRRQIARNRTDIRVIDKALTQSDAIEYPKEGSEVTNSVEIPVIVVDSAQSTQNENIRRGYAGVPDDSAPKQSVGRRKSE